MAGRTAQGRGTHCPLRLPETAHKARRGYFYGQEQTAGQAGDRNTVAIRDGMQDGRERE